MTLNEWLDSNIESQNPQLIESYHIAHVAIALCKSWRDGFYTPTRRG